MFKPFALTRTGLHELAIYIVPMFDSKFYGRRKLRCVRVRFQSGAFEQTDLFWCPERFTRQQFIDTYVEERAKQILHDLDDKIE